MTTTAFLIIRADGTVRVVTRSPRLRSDEVAYRLVVKLPRGWGTVLGELAITMPEDLPTAVVVDEPVLPEVEP